jgi:hypothetical protein
MLQLKLLGKEEQDKPKRSKMKEIVKIWAKINETETKEKKKYKESAKQKAGSLKN